MNSSGIYEFNMTVPAGAVSDNEYPLFSNYWDNNGSLLNSGMAYFNVTLQSTNGTVFLGINGTNYTAFNATTNVYNVSVNFTNSGVYNYYWGAWGNGTGKNYNVSALRYYTVNGTIDTIYPNVTLNLPVNGANLTYTNVTFNCSATDDIGLQNITLYFNSSSGGDS